MSEKVLAIRIDEKLQREIKIHLAKKGLTLKEYISNLIEDDLVKEKRRENNTK